MKNRIYCLGFFSSIVTLSVMSFSSADSDVHMHKYAVRNSTNETLTWTEEHYDDPYKSMSADAGSSSFRYGPTTISSNGYTKVLPLNTKNKIVLKDFLLDGKTCVYDNPSDGTFVLEGIPYNASQPEITISVYYPWFGRDGRCHIQTW